MKKEFYLVQKFSILLAIVIIGSGFLSCENQFFKEAAGIYEVNFEANGGTKVSTVNTDRIVFSPVTSKNNCEFLPPSPTQMKLSIPSPSLYNEYIRSR